ncbi:MAG: toll/interleukin-1 receptor domain-containing protein [Planctomycetes bacterium]|nr:toll/interleukin-1 receptor domain-containing protein [Planctomycetota bacterium]
MKIFLSYARKDIALARELAKQLSRVGFDVWNSDEAIAPGDNWAKKIGKALDDSHLMVILLTPKAMESDWLRQEIEYALGSRKYEGRVFTVFAGPVLEAGKDMPWILLRLPHRQVDHNDFTDAVSEIRAMASTQMSHSNA